MSKQSRQYEVTEQELQDAVARRDIAVAPKACLSADLLRLLADGRLDDKGERLRALQHLAICGHCAHTLAEMRKASQVPILTKDRRPTRRFRTAIGVVLVAMLLVASVLWILRQRSEKWGSSENAAVVDLRNDLVTRSVENPASEIAHTARQLKLILPVGTAIGRYDVEVLGQNNSRVLQGSGMSRRSDAGVELVVDCDFRQVTPGRYNLALRHGNSQWETHSIIVE